MRRSGTPIGCLFGHRRGDQDDLEKPELFRDYEITKGKMDDVFLAVTGKS